MQKSLILAGVTSLALALAANAAVINEVYVNPPGTDDAREYIELRGTPGELLDGLTLLEIEGDGTGAGVIDLARSLNGLAIGSTGYLVLGNNWETSTPYSIPTGTTIANLNRTPTATIENGSVTFILARDFTGALTNDLDTNNDGTLDVTPWSAVVDNIGWAEDSVVTASDIVYLGAAIGNAGIPPGTIDAASRSFTDLTPGSAGAWFNSDIIDDDLDLIYFPDRLSGTPTTDRLTPGSANVPEPTSAALLAVGSILLRRRRA